MTKPKPAYLYILPDDENTLYDTITDAEVATTSHQHIYSPPALEIIRARHKRARGAVQRMYEENRCLRERNTFLENAVPNKEHA